MPILSFRWVLPIGVVFLFIFGRIVPHLANVSPCIALAVFLGQHSHRGVAQLAIFMALLLSDALIYWLIAPYSLGSWVFFTYSGMLLSTYLGSRLSLHASLAGFGMTLLANLLYWIWTNLGTWLFSTLYSHDISGLITCYTLALPFLKHSMAANSLWGLLLVAATQWLANEPNAHSSNNRWA